MNKERNLFLVLFTASPWYAVCPMRSSEDAEKKNCKCSEGKLHGPYPALSVNSQGQKRVVMIKRSDAPVVMKEAKRYHYFQKKLARIRTTNREIDMLLALLKEKTLRDYR